jgi:competence protein ComEC
LNSENEVHYGDEIKVEGVYKDGKLAVSKVDEIKYSSNIFAKLRTSVVEFYKSSLSEPHASLVAGITIGAKSNLSPNLSRKLRMSGTSHVVVASGMNITMVGEFVLTILLLFLSRRKSVILTILIIWFYTILTGFESPIVRAVIMATIAFTGQVFGRVSNTLRYILLSCFLMLFISPGWIKDVGFILSFATTISLVLFQSKVDKMIKFIPGIIREDLSTSIAAQIGSAPIIYYFFGNFNLLSPFINVLVLWTVPIIMILGGFSAALSFFFPELARLIVQLNYPLTSYFISVI